MSIVTIKEKTFEKKIKKFNLNLSYYPHFSYLLNNKNNELILLTTSYYSLGYYSYFQELEYSSCSDTTIYNIYNGDKTKIELNIIPRLDNDNDDIYFFMEKEFNSLICKYIPKNEAFCNKDNIYYNLSLDDFDYIQMYHHKEIKFSDSPYQNISQVCKLIIDFTECKKECDICTKNDDCYDKNWNKIYFKTDLEKYFFIVPTVILGMLIVLISLSLIRCFERKPLSQINENAIQSEIPLISQ